MVDMTFFDMIKSSSLLYQIKLIIFYWDKFIKLKKKIIGSSLSKFDCRTKKIVIYIFVFAFLWSKEYTQPNRMDTCLHPGQYKKRVYEFDERCRLCPGLNYLAKMRKYRVLTCSSVLTSARCIITLFYAVNFYLKSGWKGMTHKEGGK